MSESAATPESAGLGQGRPMRSHARRNRERIVDAARDALTGPGPEVSLNEIARRAGVGIGTLFRHFPTRDALLETLVADPTVALCTEAKELLDAPEPAEALTVWLRNLLAHVTTVRGACAALLAEADEGARNPSAQAIQAMTGALLQRAQATGRVRTDLDTTALISLVCALSWVREQHPDQVARVDLVLTVFADGSRAEPTRRVPVDEVHPTV